MKPLPRGRHGLSPEYVAQNQRGRLIAGLTEAIHEVGYPQVTVGLIGQRAAVSKSDFYRHFASKGECFDAAYDAGVEHVRERTKEACATQPEKEWAGRVGAAISALLALFRDEPALASLVLVEGPRAGRSVQDRYRLAVASFACSLREGAPEAPVVAAPEEIGEAVVGGIATVLGSRVLARETAGLEDLRPALLEFALTPYLGAAEARRIISAG